MYHAVAKRVATTAAAAAISSASFRRRGPRARAAKVRQNKSNNKRSISTIFLITRTSSTSHSKEVEAMWDVLTASVRSLRVFFLATAVTMACNSTSAVMSMTMTMTKDRPYCIIWAAKWSFRAIRTTTTNGNVQRLPCLQAASARCRRCHKILLVQLTAQQWNNPVVRNRTSRERFVNVLAPLVASNISTDEDSEQLVRSPQTNASSPASQRQQADAASG